MSIQLNRHTPDDWGERAVHWLKQRFVNWPSKAVAAEIGKPESVVRSWFLGECRPDRKELQRLAGRYASEGFSSFVFGAPCRDELHARIQAVHAEIIQLSEFLRTPPSRVVSGDDSRGMPVARHQDHRKAVK